MLTTNMTNRQKANYYFRLHERAEALFMRALNKKYDVVRDNAESFMWIAHDLASRLEKVEDHEIYKLRSTMFSTEEAQLIKRVEFFYKLDREANKMGIRFLEKARLYYLKAIEDEANN